MPPTPRRTLAALTLAVAATGLGVVQPAPASADGAAIFDEDSPGSPDVRRVWISNNHPDRIRVSVRYDGSLPDLTRVYVDTDRRDPGPEFLLYQDIDSSSAVRRFSVHRIDRWGQDPTVRTAVCSDLRAKPTTRPGGARKMNYVVPRSCLDDPGVVRVAVHVLDRTSARDWAPRPRHFGRAVPQR